MIIKKFVYYLPSLAIMAVIFYLSALSSTGISGSLFYQFIIHKSLHILVYSLLSACLYFALSKTTTKSSKQISAIAIFITFLYGITDEIHQSFVPGREGKFTDTLFDLFGAFLGVCVIRRINKLIAKTHR